MSFGRPQKFEERETGKIVEAQRVIYSHCGNRDPESVSRQISALQVMARHFGCEADLSDVDNPGIFVDTIHGQIRANAGEWIVREENGDLRVFGKENFCKVYFKPIRDEDDADKRERLSNELLEVAPNYKGSEQSRIEDAASLLTLPPGGRA
jgi:hypothetical protein